MKAIYRGFILLISVVTLAGCDTIRDNLDDCPDPDRNLILHFDYFDGKGNDIFADRIQMVDVILFDRDYKFYNWIYLNKSNLDEFQGVRTSVDPGEYHIVCWANISSSRNDIEGGSSIGSMINHYNPASADPLHYAPDMRAITSGRTRTKGVTRLGELSDDGTWVLEVAPTGTTEDVIDFMSAHRTVNVYLQNFPGMDDAVPTYPEVSITNLSDYYNLNLSRTAPESTYFVQTSNEVTIEGERYSHAKFYVPHFDNDNNVHVVISIPEPYNLTETVSMEKILEINEIDTVYDGDDIVLELVMIWGDTYVTIEYPKFKTQEIKPEF